MLIFHEGLPRSGKSYEATKEHIVPALKKGRKVFARINGINHEKFAELAGITLEECQQLLIPLSEEQVPTIYQHVENDSLVIIDELQNFFPSGRTKLSDEMTKFVTEHGHRGLDIVCMGQSLADCHNIWRRRIQRKIQFLKLDMIGRAGSYKWTAYQGHMKANGEIDFTKISSGTKKYDPQYFGTYASHQADTENKDNLEDARLNLFGQWQFRVGIPLFLCAVIYAVYYLFDFFGGGATVVNQPNKVELSPGETISPGKTQQPDFDQAQTTQNKKQVVRPKDWDFVQENSQRYKCKLTYLSAYQDFLIDALIVWVDENDRVIDKLYKDDLFELGYSISVHSYGIKISKGNFEQMFRWLPENDPVGAVSRDTQNKLQQESKG